MAPLPDAPFCWIIKGQFGGMPSFISIINSRHVLEKTEQQGNNQERLRNRNIQPLERDTSLILDRKSTVILAEKLWQMHKAYIFAMGNWSFSPPHPQPPFHLAVPGMNPEPYVC